MKSSVFRLTAAAMCLALCLLLPFLTGQIPTVGQLLCPMHLPVLLCGLLCGWQYGLGIGLAAPLLRSLWLGMPPLFPTATSMAVELAVYGLVSALSYRLLPKKAWSVYLALLIAMIAGRVAGGAFQLVLLGIGHLSDYSLLAFFTAYVTGTLPGVALQFLLVPPVVLLVERYQKASAK
jgi:hypothetical protein